MKLNLINPSTNSLHFGDGIFSHGGEMHKKYRRLLSPMFSTSHMREQSTLSFLILNSPDSSLSHLPAPLFFQITNKVKSAWLQKLSASTSNGPQEIEVLNWTTRTALELIGQAGLGFSFDSLTNDDEGSDYANAVKLLLYVSPLIRISIWR
jgi:hypothetical protein